MCGLQQEQTEIPINAEGQRVLGLSNLITTMGMTYWTVREQNTPL